MQTDQAAALNDRYQTDTREWAAHERRIAEAEPRPHIRVRMPKPGRRPKPQPRASSIQITR